VVLFVLGYGWNLSLVAGSRLLVRDVPKTGRLRIRHVHPNPTARHWRLPTSHGQALAEEIPDARLPQLQKAGHGVERIDWETIAHAIHEHTAKARP